MQGRKERSWSAIRGILDADPRISDERVVAEQRRYRGVNLTLWSLASDLRAIRRYGFGIPRVSAEVRYNFPAAPLAGIEWNRAVARQRPTPVRH